MDMEQSMRTALNSILDEYEERRTRENAARKAEQASLEAFLLNVAATLETVVAPRFESFAEELRKHHHACTIEWKKADEADKRGEVMIKITVFAEGVKLPHGNASFSYVALSHRQRLSAHRSVTSRDGGLIPGTIGEYELAQITPTLVDQNLLELAQAVFASR